MKIKLLAFLLLVGLVGKNTRADVRDLNTIRVMITTNGNAADVANQLPISNHSIENILPQNNIFLHKR